MNSGFLDAEQQKGIGKCRLLVGGFCIDIMDSVIEYEGKRTVMTQNSRFVMKFIPY
jgi:hypothetical protein